MGAGQILITGANRGIGLELARQYCDEGWEVLACCRSPEKATDLSRLAAGASGRLHILPLDVTQQGAIQRLSQSIKGQAIDLLFNNAGVYGAASQAGGGGSATDSANWSDVFAVNTIAPLQLVDALIPNLLLGQGKVIALMSSKMSSLSDNTSGGVYMYRSSKAALNAVGKSLAIDLAPQGLKVALLHPGWVRTDMGGPNALISPEESVKGLRDVLARLTLDQSGQLMNYDGTVIPW